MKMRIIHAIFTYLMLLVELIWKSCRDHDTTAVAERTSDILSISSGHFNDSSARAATVDLY